MSVTGLGMIERLLLAELFNPRVRQGELRFRRTDDALKALSDSSGVHPREAYHVVLDLCRPWAAHLRLLEVKGNIGSPTFEAAQARYTTVRLSPLGALVADAERRNVHLPVGMVNGNHHADGVRPPFDPRRVITAVRAVWDGADDSEIVTTVGLPEWPTRCEVLGDLQSLASGAMTPLDLRARIELRPPDLLIVTGPTPDQPSGLRGSIERLAYHLRHPDRPPAPPMPSFTVDDYSGTEVLLVLQTEPELDPSDVRDHLLKWWPVAVRVDVELGQPLVATVRAIAERTDRAVFEEFAELVEEQLTRSQGPYPASHFDAEAQERHRMIRDRAAMPSRDPIRGTKFVFGGSPPDNHRSDH